MSILIVTNGPHHGDVGGGIGEPGRTAKGHPSNNTGASSLAAGAFAPEPLDFLVVALPPLLKGGSSCVAPGPRFVLGMMKSSTSGNTLISSSLEKPKGANWRIPREKAAKFEKELPNGTNRFEGPDHERAVGSQQWFCLTRRNFPGACTMHPEPSYKVQEKA